MGNKSSTRNKADMTTIAMTSTMQEALEQGLNALTDSTNDTQFVCNLVLTYLPLASLKYDLSKYEESGFPAEGQTSLKIPISDTQRVGIWQFYGCRTYTNKQWIPLSYTFNDFKRVGLGKAFRLQQSTNGTLAAPCISAHKLVRDTPGCKEGSPDLEDVMLHPGPHDDLRLMLVRWRCQKYDGSVKIYCKVCKPLEKSDPVGISIWLNATQIFPIRNGNEQNFCIFMKPTEIELKCKVDANTTIDFAFDPVGNYYSDQTQFELHITRV